MIVELPLNYPVEARRYRERTVRTFTLRDFVDFPVREADAQEALPGALLSDGVTSEPVLCHEGRWWMRDRGGGPESGRLRGLAGLVPEGMEVAAADGSLALIMLSRYRGDFDAYVARAVKTVESENLRQVVKNGRDGALAGMARWVEENLLDVEGVLHVSVPEPFLTLTFDDDRPAVARVAMGLPAHLRRDNRTFVFPLDRRDDFEALAREYEDGTGGEVDRFCHAEDLGGPASRPDREGEDLVYAAEAAMWKTRYKAQEWPKEDAMLWYDLRDAQKEVMGFRVEGETPPDAVMDTLSEALAALCASPAAGNEAPWYCSAAAQRWHTRDLDFGPGPAGGPPARA